MVRYYGNGIINNLINNLSFELHSPGYNYLGPGTNLELKLEKDIHPINKLDEAAKEHDIAYSKSNDIKKRHEADKILEDKAWSRVSAKDASLSEKVNAYLTTNAMKFKRKMGMGLTTHNSSTEELIDNKNENKDEINFIPKCGRYIKYPISLNEDQQKQVYDAMKNKTDITIKLEPIQLQRTKESVMNETYLPLTRKQINSIKKHVSQSQTGLQSKHLNNKTTLKIFTLKLSMSQLQSFNNEKIGGFLPALLPLIPAIGAAVTAGTTLYRAYNDKKTNDKLLEEKIRHNKALEEKYIKSGNGMLLKKSGNGMLLKKNLILN